MKEEHKPKRWRIISCIFLSLAFLLGVWFWSISELFSDMADSSYKYTDTYVSPNGAYTVAVYRSDGTWSFGPAKVKIVAGDEEEVYETEIRDDGGTGDVTVHWLDDVTVRIVLHGSEQKDETVTVVFSGKIQLITDRAQTKE